MSPRVPKGHKCKGTRRWDHTYPSGKETHGYDIDGKCVPGITTIDGILDKGGLNYFYGHEAFLCAFDDPTVALMDRDEAEKWVTGAGNRAADAAAKVGTKLHAYAEAYQRTGHLAEPDEDIEAMVNQFLEWERAYKPSYVLTEFVVFNMTWRYGGTGDMCVDLPGYGRGYIDIKTGGKWRNGERDEKGRVHTSIYKEHGLQASAIRHAECYAQSTSLAPVPKMDWAATLHIRPEFYELVAVDSGDAAFEAFCGLRQAYDWTENFEPGPEFVPDNELLSQPTLTVVEDVFEGLP